MIGEKRTAWMVPFQDAERIPKDPEGSSFPLITNEQPGLSQCERMVR